MPAPRSSERLLSLSPLWRRSARCVTRMRQVRCGASPDLEEARGSKSHWSSPATSAQRSSRSSSRTSSRPTSQPPPHSSYSHLPHTPSSPFVVSASVDPAEQHVEIKAEVDEHLRVLSLVQDALRVRLPRSCIRRNRNKSSRLASSPGLATSGGLGESRVRWDHAGRDAMPMRRIGRDVCACADAARLDAHLPHVLPQREPLHPGAAGARRRRRAALTGRTGFSRFPFL